MYSLFIVTWTRKPKELGLNTQNKMQTNGLVKQQKQVELIKHHGSYMLSVYIKDCTSLEEIQCLK